jgi:YqjK-like protein
MPQSREQQLLYRREQLVARSGQLRGDLAAQAGHLAPRGLLMVSAQRGWQWLQYHPQWVVGAVALLLVLRPQRAWQWSGRLLAAWQIARRTAPLWRTLLARRR